MALANVYLPNIFRWEGPSTEKLTNIYQIDAKQIPKNLEHIQTNTKQLGPAQARSEGPQFVVCFWYVLFIIESFPGASQGTIFSSVQNRHRHAYVCIYIHVYIHMCIVCVL